ncbi:hypothetical protein ACFL6U_13695 [Planctomycetota bacterium]
MGKDERQFSQLIERLDIDTKARPAFKQALRERMLAEFEQETTPARLKQTRRISWRTIMKSPLVKLSTAAVIGIVLMIVMLGEHPSGIALGEMLEKLKQIQVFTYDHEWTIEQEGGSVQVITSKVYFSEFYGHRSDTYLGDQILAQTFTPPTGNQITQLFPSSKKVMKAIMTEKQIKEMRQKSDPRWWLTDLEDFHTVDLGRKREDGRELIGIKIDDPAYLAFMFEEAQGELWVDAQTQLPVRLEVNATSAHGGIKNRMVASGFNWEWPLDAEIFEPNIPEDYTQQALADFSGTEENALKGLRIFAQVTGGQYPSSLDIMTAIREMVMAVQFKRSLDPDAERPTDVAMPFTSTETAQLVALRASCTFFGDLKKKQPEVAYYGEKVRAEHADKVLLRWQQEDGQYRVIFGDLHVEVLSETQLKELEESKAFRELLEAPRGPSALKAPGNCTGNRQVDRYAVKDDHVQVTSTIEQPTWPEGKSLVIRLPYQQAILTSVVAEEREWAFEAIDARTYRIETLTSPPGQVTYTWTVALSELKYEKGQYRVELQTGVAVPFYQVDVSIDATGPWMYFQGTGELEFTPFDSGQTNTVRSVFGSCGLCIKAKESP